MEHKFGLYTRLNEQQPLRAITLQEFIDLMKSGGGFKQILNQIKALDPTACLLYTSPSPRDS